MPETKRVILTLSTKMHEELSKQASELGLSIPDFIRYLLARRTEEFKNTWDFKDLK